MEVEEADQPYFVEMIRAIFTGELLISKTPSDVVKVLVQCDKVYRWSPSNDL